MQEREREREIEPGEKLNTNRDNKRNIAYLQKLLQRTKYVWGKVKNHIE